MTEPISVAMLHRLLICDAEAGKLYWRERTPDLFLGTLKPLMACSNFNKRFGGKPAFTATDGSGYFFGSIFYRGYKAHRIIYAMAIGSWPCAEIDHINGVRSDNRITNLRSVNDAENARNRVISVNNTSGVMGVYWAKASNKWQASISQNGKNQHLGFFDDFSSAVAARRSAEGQLDYHPNHGRAAR